MDSNHIKNPPTKIGLICGTGLEKAAAQFLEHYTETKIVTPFGQVYLNICRICFHE